MPSSSIKQQKFMGLALAYKRGEIPASKVSSNVKKVARSMSEKELEKYAGTKHKGLPKKVESLIPMEELRKIVSTAVSEVINEAVGKDEEESQAPILTPEEKKSYLESIAKFSEYGKSIYRRDELKKSFSEIKKIVEFASKNIVDESGDWFDKVTLGRHSKKLGESLKLFEKTAKEMTQLQQRLEAVYEEMGETLSRYYEIEDGDKKEPMVTEDDGETVFYAFWNNNKHEIKAKDLYAAKLAAIEKFKIPKSKQGLLAIMSKKAYDQQEFRFR